MIPPFLKSFCLCVMTSTVAAAINDLMSIASMVACARSCSSCAVRAFCHSVSIRDTALGTSPRNESTKNYAVFFLMYAALVSSNKPDFCNQAVVMSSISRAAFCLLSLICTFLLMGEDEILAFSCLTLSKRLPCFLNAVVVHCVGIDVFMSIAERLGGGKIEFWPLPCLFHVVM